MILQLGFTFLSKTINKYQQMVVHQNGGNPNSIGNFNGKMRCLIIKCGSAHIHIIEYYVHIIHMYGHIYIYLFIYLFMYVWIFYLFIYLFIYSFIHLLIHLLIYAYSNFPVYLNYWELVKFQGGPVGYLPGPKEAGSASIGAFSFLRVAC